MSGNFLKAFFKVTTFQVATTQMCNFQAATSKRLGSEAPQTAMWAKRFG